MTEYTGFISSLVERSEKVLGVNSNSSDQTSMRDTSVTRLLLLLNAGFSMVWDRIDTVQNNDDPKFKNAFPETFKTRANNTRLSNNLIIGDINFFQRTSKDLTWHVHRVPNFKNPHDISILVKELSDKSILPKTKKSNTYKELFISLRNSFAHGGIHPMSPRQTNDIAFIERLKLQNPKSAKESEIYKVFFVSKWGEYNNAKGHTIIEFPIAALMNFWHDWREVILSNKVINLLEYDNAA